VHPTRTLHSIPSSPQKPDMWTASIGKPLRLNPPLFISTEVGFRLSKSWNPPIGSLKTFEHDPGPIGNADPYP
jgi:hypothetical protein